MSCGKRWRNLNPYDLHKILINDYFISAKNRASLLQRDTSKDKRDIDVIRANHQFLWEDDEDGVLSWEKRLAKKYYDKLYKEYCVGDLSRYKENKIGLRWRTEHELIEGKGQFSCGSKRCGETDGLKTWEVNFGYVEGGTKKNALVKLRLCVECSYKLNYHYKKKEVKRLKQNRAKIVTVKDESTGSSRRNEDHESNEEANRSNKQLDGDEVNEQSSDQSGIWKHNLMEKEEAEGKTREEEFDEYLDQLFM